VIEGRLFLRGETNHNAQRKELLTVKTGSLMEQESPCHEGRCPAEALKNRRCKYTDGACQEIHAKRGERCGVRHEDGFGNSRRYACDELQD
jgi:hypothetical protein